VTIRHRREFPVEKDFTLHEMRLPDPGSVPMTSLYLAEDEWATFGRAHMAAIRPFRLEPIARGAATQRRSRVGAAAVLAALGALALVGGGREAIGTRDEFSADGRSRVGKA
jgi:hypothetical protein